MEHDQRRAQLEALYTTHGTVVRRYLRRRTDPATADDLLSEVFVVVWTRLERIPPDPLPWLLACARNVLAHSRRSEQRRAALIDRLHATQTPARERDEGGGKLGEALAALGERDREALLLIAWEGLSPEQAATTLGCSRRALAMRLHRARKRLDVALHAVDHMAPPKPIEACND
ncbi:MAG TPA: RNA polymerase sigma factor [Solirubrobacteraceae bacterium]|jgi:RNA polymerase sigma-70 factor (ECF subfamily)|nr:RNA polymerase sigma factor [Solirubrobacteraceae bacterium]